VEDSTGRLRIGELSRRVGVSRELLRTWERRYSLLQPTRSNGDFRLYSAADEQRVRAMLRYLDSGLSAAQAAQAARATAASDEWPASDLPAARAGLSAALGDFDDARAHTILDRLLATFGIGAVLAEVLLPVLRELGDAWAAGEITVAQEHFATSVLRGRMLGLARGWGSGAGPLALLACPPGELHDMGLLSFGIALREAGWRIGFLGADTPMAAIADGAESLDASVVVLSAVAAERLRAVEGEITGLALVWSVALGGAGADPALAERVGAVALADDAIAAAADLALTAAR